MTKCSRCRQKKAKRRCPALRSDLCPSCCGLLREKEVTCPPTCRFLTEHKPYQEKRTLLKSKPVPPDPLRKKDDISRDERLTWLALNIEAPLKDSGESNPSFTDGAAILALEYAKEKLTRNRAILLIPGEDRKPGNEAGEKVFLGMENCRYEGSVLLASGAEGYSGDDKLRCLEHLIRIAKSWSRGNFEGRAYIDHLRDQFAEIATLARRSNVITPR